MELQSELSMKKAEKETEKVAHEIMVYLGYSKVMGRPEVKWIRLTWRISSAIIPHYPAFQQYLEILMEKFHSFFQMP